MTENRIPFRADHVGSLLRPQRLHEARAKAARGEITREALHEVEDSCILDAIRLQESIGLQAITDGEFRRTIWHTDFLTGFDGIVATRANYSISFRGEHGEVTGTGSMMVVKEKVRRSHPIQVADYAFVKAHTSRTAKTCIPGPTYLHMRGGRNIVDKLAYPEMDQFWADVVDAYHQELAGMADAGCKYLQIDDVSFASMCDAGVQEAIRRDGEEPARLPAMYTKIINDIVAGRPKGMSITMHTCRGNFRSMWMAEGGYDAVAEAMFGGLQVDGLFLEFDSARAGGFAPLRFTRPGMRVVLGLVSSKIAALESKDDLKRRIEEAAKYVKLENLCLSPQCGFASDAAGNELTEDDQRRKLELVVRTAEEVWGTNA
jgi:5-methyltetrahydropteroyltriglutamate--homocysteine methyltransferase